MNTINNLTSSLISNQIPNFIANEYPLFVDFIKTYYQGLERSGESLDLINNLLTYLDIDFYQNEINTSCILNPVPNRNNPNLIETDTTIVVDNTSGFPDTDGLIQIDSEIILYKTKTDTEFLSCSRGISGVNNIGDTFTYSYSTAATHSVGSKVTNLSYLFILYFFSKLKNEYLQYFNQNFADGLNISTFIKNIKHFYNIKGTSKSFDLLIRAFFNVKNETLYPKERLIKPSDAIFSISTIIKCKAISGNPLELVGQKVFQETLSTDPCGNSVVGAFAYIDSVQERFTNTDSIYELTVDNSVPPNDIIIPPTTKLINFASDNDTIITVDSTIGFNKSGFIKIGEELIKYTDKTINQFLNCTRGYCNTTATSHQISTEINSTFKFYGYSNIDESIINLEILGVCNSTIITDPGLNYFEDDVVYADQVGYSDDSILTTNWLFNAPKRLRISSISVDGQNVTIKTEYEHGLYIGDSVIISGIDDPLFCGTKIVNFVNTTNEFVYELDSIPTAIPSVSGYVYTTYKLGNNNIPADVINVYDQNNKNLYIASSGVPSHRIGSGISLGNQRLLKRIPRIPLNTGIPTTISSGDIGIFVNGVLAQSCISSESITYGDITDISIDNSGSDYGVGIFGGPSLTIANGTGITATAVCTVNGSVKKINVLNGGSGYYAKPVIQIIGCGGTSGTGGSGAQAEAIINNGVITSVVIHTAGSGYTCLPSINVFGGGGSGALLDPIVTGPINKVEIINHGTGYTSIPNITINLGNGAIGAPIISNGKIISVAVINGGSGYDCVPDVYVNDSKGTGKGAQIIANISNGSVTSFTVVSSGINYTDGYTSVSVVSSGSGAILIPKVRKWTYDLVAKTTLDENNGHSNIGRNAFFGNQYFYLATPKGLRYQKSDNLQSNLNEVTSPTHSPLLGWAYDGNPIYGPYGYVNPLDIGSGISAITSSYIKNTSRINGPSIDEYELGTFIEDYTYSSGMLDKYNGRYCITPEFPNGTYAYFTTIDSDGKPSFPYILANEYYSVPDTWNFKTTSTQDNLPLDVLRYRGPYQNIDFNYKEEDSYNYFPRVDNPPKFSVKTVEHGTSSNIDDFYIENPGINYKVGDRLTFNNVGTGGYGASAKVSYVSGSGITSASIKQFTKINYRKLNSDFDISSKIIGLTSGTGATIYHVDSKNSNLYVTSSSSFNYGEVIASNYNSTISTGITTKSITPIGSGYTSFSTGSSLGIIDTNISLNSGIGISIGNSLLIGNEILKVFSGSGNTFGVYRGQFGTSSAYYGSGTSIYLLPSITVINSSCFEIGNYVKINNEIFRIVDLNNSTNSITLLRSQLDSSLSTHNGNSTIYQVNVSTAIVNSCSETYVASLSTGSSSYLNQNDIIKVSSGSTFDYAYTGTFNILSSSSFEINYENKIAGTGNSGILSYITNSPNVSGPIALIQLNSGGSLYKTLPSISVSSVNGIGASILAKSNNTGKIKELKVDEFGHGLNPDITLKPELSFAQIFNLNKTLSLESIKIISPGNGYLYNPIITISGGDGVNASAIATINNGQITKVTVTNSGYGYSSIPTITANKSFPCYINSFNSTLNFSINISDSIETGDIVRIYCDGTYPTLIGGLKVNSSTIFYAIVGSGLDDNQIQLASSHSYAISGIYSEFSNIGTGNINLISEEENAELLPILKTKDFLSGEKIYQKDSLGNTIASGIIYKNGWNSSTKRLRIINVSGKFKLNLPIFGVNSNASGYLYAIEYASGRILVGSSTRTNGEFITETGNISNREQHIIDSDYYQEYSYVLKNEIDYKNWANSIKNIAHPSGFKLYGNKVISSGASHISSGQSSSTINLNQNLGSNLSLSTYNNYAIAQPDYTTSLKDQINIYNRLLTSSEKIKTSIVDRIDDISNVVVNYVGNGTTTEFIFTTNQTLANLVKKPDLTVLVDNSLQSASFYDLQYELDKKYNITGAKIVFKSPVGSGSSIQIIGAGLNFDGTNKNFPITFNGNELPPRLNGTSYTNEQILITLNGVIQTQNSYEISQKYQIEFNEIPTLGSKINVLRVTSGASYSEQIISTGSSSYSISSGASNNTSLVVIDGIIQNSDAYTISDTEIVFTENVPDGSTIYIRSYGSGISSRQLVGVGITSSIIPISVNISSPNYAIVSLNGIVQDPSTYTIGTGSTCIIFPEEISRSSSIYIINFDQKLDYYNSIVADGYGKTYITDTKITNDDDYIITINGIVQIPGETNSFVGKFQELKNINFSEPPKPRTKFFGLFYNRIDPSGNATIDDLSKTYFTYNTINGSLVPSDYLQNKNDYTICNITSVDTINKLVTVDNFGSLFSSGQTVISGLASSISTGITTTVTGSGVTSIFTTLGTSVSIKDSSFSVGSTFGFAPNDYIIIDNEIMKLSSISSGSTFNVIRGTNQLPHIENSKIYNLKTTFSVGSTNNFSINDYILIDSEVMRITGISSGSSSFVVSRGLVNTPISYHSQYSIVKKIIPTEFTISSGSSGIYYGFNGSGTTFKLTTNGSPYNYNGKSFNLSSDTDIYGQAYNLSLLTVLNGVVQKNNAPGAFTLLGDTITFAEPPKYKADFFGRFLGKLRVLDDISSKFNGTKLAFNLSIANGKIYSITSANSSIDISNNVLVFINGSLQNPGESFNIIGSRIIFSEPPKPGSTFLAYVYIGSDDDIESLDILAPIEEGDKVFIDGEEYNRNIISVNSSSSISTLGYTGLVKGNNASITAIVSTGKITSLIINNGGYGYSEPPIIWFLGGGGYGAQATAVVKNGVIVNAVITNPGENYTTAPNVVIVRNLALSKTQRVRAEYELTYKKVTSISTGLTFGNGTSLPEINQTINIGNTDGFNPFGTIKIIDNTKSYPVIELVTYNNISGNNLTGCVRGAGYNFNKILLLDGTDYTFSCGQSITNGSGATGKVINWDSKNSLLFVNRTSNIDFNNGDTIVSVGAGISDAAFIQKYLSYGVGTTIIQIR